jgi:hypothetical protein
MKINGVDVRQQDQVTTGNEFAVLENLEENRDVNRARYSIT